MSKIREESITATNSICSQQILADGAMSWLQDGGCRENRKEEVYLMGAGAVVVARWRETRALPSTAPRADAEAAEDGVAFPRPRWWAPQCFLPFFPMRFRVIAGDSLMLRTCVLVWEWACRPERGPALQKANEIRCPSDVAPLQLCSAWRQWQRGSKRRRPPTPLAAVEFESGPHATCHPAEKEEPSNTRFVFHLVQSCTRNKKRREFSILFCNVFPRKYLLN
jgi:hypothetical protein